MHSFYRTILTMKGEKEKQKRAGYYSSSSSIVAQYVSNREYLGGKLLLVSSEEVKGFYCIKVDIHSVKGRTHG